MKSKQSLFDGTVFKKTVCRFWPLWAAYFVLWLIILPLQGLMDIQLGRIYAESGIRNYGYVNNFANRTVPNSVEGVLTLAVVFGVLAAMAVFSHLYNARSANLFGSLPIRREGLFATHYLAGLSGLLVPNVVIFLLTLIVEGLGGCVCMRGLLFWLAVSCGECFFFYSMAVFCGMFTGHLLALPAFYAILNMFAYGVAGLLYMTLNSFYYGFAGFSPWAEKAIRWLTPVIALGQNVRSSWEFPPNTTGVGDAFDYYSQQILRLYGLGTVGIYALAGVALVVCAFLLYRARRMESAGDVVSVRPMKPVFKYGVAICVGMVFGVGTAWMVGMGSSETLLMASILVWGVIGYFAAQMLLDKSFKVFHKWRGAVAVAGVFGALFLVVGFDLTGFETRVPSAADVKSVYVSGLSVVNYDDDGDRVSLDVSDPDQIALLVALHQAAVEQRDWARATSSGSDSTTVWVDLEYTLNNGSTLSRSYRVVLNRADIGREGSAAWAVEQLYHDSEFYWRVYGFDVLEKELAFGMRLDSVEFYHYKEEWGGIGDTFAYGNDARALLDAVEEDMRAGRIGVRTLGEAKDYYYYNPRDSLTFRVVAPANSDTLTRLEIALQDTASSTLAELRRLEANMDNESIRDAFEGWLK